MNKYGQIDIEDYKLFINSMILHFLMNRFIFWYFSCRRLKTIKSDESYIPCTLAYLRISIIILFNEQFKVNYSRNKCNFNF